MQPVHRQACRRAPFPCSSPARRSTGNRTCARTCSRACNAWPSQMVVAAVNVQEKVKVKVKVKPMGREGAAVAASHQPEWRCLLQSGCTLAWEGARVGLWRGWRRSRGGRGRRSARKRGQGRLRAPLNRKQFKSQKVRVEMAVVEGVQQSRGAQGRCWPARAAGGWLVLLPAWRTGAATLETLWR